MAGTKQKQNTYCGRITCRKKGHGGEIRRRKMSINKDRNIIKRVVKISNVYPGVDITDMEQS